MLEVQYNKQAKSTICSKKNNSQAGLLWSREITTPELYEVSLQDSYTWGLGLLKPLVTF